MTGDLSEEKTDGNIAHR